MKWIFDPVVYGMDELNISSIWFDPYCCGDHYFTKYFHINIQVNKYSTDILSLRINLKKFLYSFYICHIHKTKISFIIAPQNLKKWAMILVKLNQLSELLKISQFFNV